MRRVLLLAAGLTLLGAGPAAARSSEPSRAPARLLVQASEFRLSLSRTTVPAGTAIVQLANIGMDPHDLRLAPLRGGRARTIAETLPGGRGQWNGKLTRGRWRLVCTLEGHAAAGMRATLRVR